MRTRPTPRWFTARGPSVTGGDGLARLRPLMVALVLLAGAAEAAESKVPPALQAALLKKVLTFDSLLEGTTPRIAVVYGTEAVSVVDALVAAFTSMGLQAKPVRVSAFAASSDVNVAYLMPSAVLAETTEHCAAIKALSVSPDAQTTVDGKTTLGFDLADGRPQLVVHLARMRAEGHAISSSVLALARVIR